MAGKTRKVRTSISQIWDSGEIQDFFGTLSEDNFPGCLYIECAGVWTAFLAVIPVCLGV